MALKDVLTELYDQLNDMIESIDLLYAGLLTNNLKVVDEAEGLLNPMSERTDILTEKLIEESKADPKVSIYVSIPSHIGQIRKELEKIAVDVRTKAADALLFSDKAFTEAEYLFERIRDMLMHAKDMILARNTLIARHLIESEKAVERTADQYSTAHEERLIEGLCTPKASGLFIDMLGAFKVIAWNAKEIARDLG